MAKISPFDKDEDGKPIDTTTVQYQESVKVYEDWSNKDRKVCFAMLYCMHDDLIGELEACPTAKDMWDRLKVRFFQTSAMRPRTLHLKWI